MNPNPQLRLAPELTDRSVLEVPPAPIPLAVIVDTNDRRHLEASIGSSVTACGRIASSFEEVVDGATTYDCPECHRAALLADELHGQAHHLRRLAGAALLAADRRDLVGGTLDEAT